MGVTSVAYMQAIADGDGFYAIGVAAEEDSKKGVEYLSGFGQFSEVSAGRIGSNSVVSRLVPVGQTTGTPMILVSFRSSELLPSGQYRYGPDTVVTTLIGTRQIFSFARWITGHGPAPTSEVPTGSATFLGDTIKAAAVK